jgi:hypothetical protein
VVSLRVYAESVGMGRLQVSEDGEAGLITSKENTMTEYKSREEISEWTGLFNVGSQVNNQRLADLAVLREWMEEQRIKVPIDQRSDDILERNYLLDDLLSFITSCEAKLK